MTDDELISAYVDGLLSQPERAALEMRVQADAGLRRRVAATQLLAREARQLPNTDVPRNFILPRDFGQNKPAPAPASQPRRSLFPAWVFRIGSAAAALLFVSVLALEVTRPVAFSPGSLPYAAPAPAEAPAAPMADMARNAMEATVTMDVLAEGATTNVQPMAATVTLPTLDLAQAQTKAAPGASVLSSSEANGAAAGSAASAAPEALLLTATPAPAPAATLPEIAAGPEVSQRSMFTVPAAAVTAAESQTVATPQPAPAVTSPPTQPEPLITPLRVLAAIALITAIVLGALGWLRK